MRETTRPLLSAGVPTLLLTRPEAQSRRFAAEVAGLWPDLAVLLAPAQAIRSLPVVMPQGVRGIVLTSENAVAALPPGLGLPAYCVGERTAAAAAAHGLSARAAGGDAASLLSLIRRERPSGPLFHPHGRHLAADMVAALRDEVEITGAVAYEQVAIPPSAEAVRLLEAEQPVLLPLFSPRSARLVAGWPIRAPLLIAAMSANVAAAWSGKAPRRLKIAPTPSAEAMLETIGALKG
ncbi:uroporphyrinogen-III synthase [Haematobacter genomosp. 1]|uniref:Uroporphyrinogen III synthase n=1 Tax=Haematobacter genomosp. 1 TaxID=366618 RepID=A0A212AGU3_9RHOB|nr:uroporphyrinogen-III synthase [Haematobacter genomosp. 1]OWJ80653.1 uroporphyrinogen III synthase [Haematobacter genomosp. 1]